MKSLRIVRTVIPMFAIAFALPICATLALERAGSAGAPGKIPRFHDAKTQTVELAHGPPVASAFPGGHESACRNSPFVELRHADDPINLTKQITWLWHPDCLSQDDEAF